MSQTPRKEANKFHTISADDKIGKSGFSTTAAYRLTQRKSNSVLANPQNLSTTLINIDHHNLSLPKIDKKRKQKKQGTFLQSWLDEALGAPDPFAVQKQNDEQKIEGNVLKTLRKYDLDKRHLQSQNIPAEKVQKLYKSLYIYSHGVNKIFEDLLQLTKEKGNNELLGNFWKAYTKLLESCTSYQTVFQKVQRDHLENINRLKRAIQSRTQSFEQQRKELENKLIKLEKRNQEKENMYNSLKNEFDVLQNTLDLTDEAFNEEVNLRLKFEEKINAVYTSYEQLKNKYHKIVEEMGIKNMDLMDRENKEDELKSKLLAEKTKVDQLIFLLKAQRDKVAERQTEIIIKNQELEDAKAKIMAKISQEDNTQDKIEQYLIKMKGLRARIIQVESVVAGQKITIKQQEQHIKKLGKSLEEYKEHNNQVYEKYSQTGKKIVVLESEIQRSNIKIIDLDKSLLEKSAQITEISRELSHVKNERDNLQHQLNISSRNLRDASDTVVKNTAILEDMKAVKDKYERINVYLKESIKELETSNNKLSQELSVKTEQIEGMKLLVESRSKAIAQLQKQIDQEREIFKSKISSLNTVITKKEALALEYQKKKEEQEKQISDMKFTLKLVEDKCVMLDSERLKLQVQLASKTKMLKELDQLLDKQNIKYKELNTKFEDELKEKSDLSSKLVTTQFVLKTKNQEERIEVTSLSALLSQYKVRIIQRAQYVHPMLYEQALQTARRCARNEEKLRNDSIKLKNQSTELHEEFQTLKNLAKDQKQKIEALESKNKSISEEKARLFEKANKLQKTIKEKTTLYENSQNLCEKLKQQIEICANREKDLKIKIRQLEDAITNLKIKNEDLMMQAKKKTRNQTREVKREVVRVTAEQEAQTQQIQMNVQKPTSAREALTLPIKIETVDHEAQTDQMEQIMEKTDVMASIYNREMKEEPMPVRKEESPQKKIETKDFRKALKLTYMRR